MSDTDGDLVKHLIPQRGLVGKTNGFAEFGDPSRPGVCLWCGHGLPAVAPATLKAAPERFTGARGAYGDNSFCGMRCGYAFGSRLAVLGSRLQVKVGT